MSAAVSWQVAADQSGESLDKVREILFGAQVKDADKRFKRIEDRMSKEVSSVQDDLRRRMDSLQAFVEGELESLGKRLDVEQRKT